MIHAESYQGQTGVEMSYHVVSDLKKLQTNLDTFLVTHYNNNFLTKEAFFVELRRREIETYYTDTSYFCVLHPQLEYLYTHADDETFHTDILKYMIFVYHYLTYIMKL
jgi:hypothetical protein